MLISHFELLPSLVRLDFDSDLPKNKNIVFYG